MRIFGILTAKDIFDGRISNLLSTQLNYPCNLQRAIFLIAAKERTTISSAKCVIRGWLRSARKKIHSKRILR